MLCFNNMMVAMLNEHTSKGIDAGTRNASEKTITIAQVEYNKYLNQKFSTRGNSVPQVTFAMSEDILGCHTV